MQYSCAIREVKTKLEVLNDELSVKNSRNPIEVIKSRIKKPASILEKLQRRGFPISVESMVKNLDDIAGIRVICSFIDDIYSISEMLARQDDVKVIAVKDYIRSPKANGYRSYHLILGISLRQTGEYYPVEVQVRTQAMDFWASMEHQLVYKSDREDKEQLAAELRKYADALHSMERKMGDFYEGREIRTEEKETNQEVG